MSNIAEDFERGSKRDFVRFLYMARGSAGELRSHLYVAKDLDYITQVDVDELENQAVVPSKSLLRFIQHCESSEASSNRVRKNHVGTRERRWRTFSASC